MLFATNFIANRKRQKRKTCFYLFIYYVRLLISSRKQVKFVSIHQANAFVNQNSARLPSKQFPAKKQGNLCA